ncbi:hypothetical protein M8C21_022774 [Ambrosia artemisiifolia]|uniref:Cyclase family protein n=1 Tax=Ambrosia artemisiifolia TaxID=4212 RepID=A0AAD5BK24_AMBAR|nr:hypothetical protein M8C21_022774 [Ambrosia artemisiifolia]
MGIRQGSWTVSSASWEHEERLTVQCFRNEAGDAYWDPRGHVDAPGHMIDEYFDAGFDVDTLDLLVLNGPALLVDVPRDSNITAEVMKSLNIPKGVMRVLFRTLNTDRRLMWQKQFDTSYVGFLKDGAQWLKDNTDIKLVATHRVFFKSGDIILVEGLKLDNVEAGIYNVHCLPLRLYGSEGSPIRCILIK